MNPPDVRARRGADERARRRRLPIVALLVLALATVGVVVPFASGAEAAGSSSLALHASATAFRPGSAIRLSATVPSAARTRTVTVQQSSSSGKWRAVATKRLAAHERSVSVSVKPAGKAPILRLRITGSGARAVATTSVKLTQKPTIVSVQRPAPFTPGAPATVKGKVSGVGKGVKVVLQRVKSGAWVNVATSSTISGGTFSIRYTARTTRADDVLRAVVPTTGTLVRAASPQVRAEPRAVIDVKASAALFVRGDKVTISGTAPRPTGATVRLQRYDTSSKTWLSTASTKITSKGYSFVTTPPGTQDARYRVVAAATSKEPATTASVTVKHRTCSAGIAPTAPYAVWFSDPTRYDGTAISSNLVSSICAAAPGSSITASVYLASAFSREADDVTETLRLVAKERGVKVSFLVDSVGTAQATIDYWRTFARVSVCTNGCLYAGPATPHLHTKMLAISATTWPGANGPVVVLGSTNWTQRQFQEYWQSATAFYGDSDLYRDQIAYWNRQVTCGAGAPAGKVNAACAGLPGVSSAQGRGGGWGLAGDPELASTKTPGLSYRFFPFVGTTDNVVADLSRMTCRLGAGGVVRVAMYTSSLARGPAIAAQLARLASEGCDVGVVLSKGGLTTNSPAAVDVYRDRPGLRVRCVSLMHLKYVVATGVTVDGQPGQSVVMDGSQNWGYNNLRQNDEVTFRLSSAGLTSAQRAPLDRLAGRYALQWSTVWSHPTSCDA